MTMILSFILPINVCMAQFDKKITFSVYGGQILPLLKKVDKDSIPYIFPNFKNIFQLGVGMQYNLNNKISIGGNLSYFNGFTYNDPEELQKGTVAASVIEEENKQYASYFSNLIMGSYFKYNFMPDKKFNPYAYGEVNLNFYSALVQPRLRYLDNTALFDKEEDQVGDKYTILRFNKREIPLAIAFGGLIGAGLDYKLSNSFKIFLQSSYNHAFTNRQGEMKIDMNYINSQLGVRFSLFKEKSLL
jgi:hypothetical protein